jgi:membrane associated rhomboid family serine protease
VVEPRLLTGFGAGDQPNALFSFLFVLDADWWTKPWTLLTSVFAHGGLGHLFFNGIILFFFGPLLEKRIGAKAFLGLVLAGGVLAGLTQVTFYSTFLGQESGVLGISGALMAVMGALTVLGPHIRVLIFFFIPAPLWAMMLGYAALDLLGFLGGGGGVAHLAHLTGLAVGLAAGWRWRQEGYAFPKRRTRLQGGMRQGF